MNIPRLLHMYTFSSYILIDAVYFNATNTPFKPFRNAPERVV